MFKKLKDKLAEEVKSSPQRIQQFAQAAQAAVTSASSSISDITSNDLFSIADNENPQNNGPKAQSPPHKQQNPFQDVSLTQSELADYSHEMDNPRQRKLSNSSFASDVSFRLPSYETPSMFHLQSDMEVSASEADDRGFSGGPATLDRVTKEQLYSAYKRTQERYTKYRNQYGDLARHYKLLERENAKARSVLVETQDKALRRISELKEQCALEQSAKAHLEKALRMEIEEKILKIESLNTKIHLLQITDSKDTEKNDNNVQLISLSNESTPKTPHEESINSEVASLNNKIEKMEQLLNKYKDNLKISKDKNSQMTIELQILSNEVDSKNKKIQELESKEAQLMEANKKIQEISDANEELQNKINANDFTKIKELSTLEIDLQKANEEINELRGKIEVFSKREEEYAISLAENKLSIHKELESKEAEIKSLKDALATTNKEVQSLKIVVSDYKDNICLLEEDKLRLTKDCTELATTRKRIDEMNEQLQELSRKCQSLEQVKTKADEEYKCLQLQLKQETAEKLAMIDRNVYLESRNTQLSEENNKKSSHITDLENEIQTLVKDKGKASENDKSKANDLVVELNTWKAKCEKLESEIQEEREELVKLQTEIEKLLANHELIQAQNLEFRTAIANLTAVNSTLQQGSLEYKNKISKTVKELSLETSKLRQFIFTTSNETRSLIESSRDSFISLVKGVDVLARYSSQTLEKNIDTNDDFKNIQSELAATCERNADIERKLQEHINEKNDFLLKAEQEAHARTLVEEKLMDIMRQLEDAVKRSQDIESENKTLHKKLEEIELHNQDIKISSQLLDSEKNDLNASLSSLKETHENLIKEFQSVTSKQKELVDQINIMTKENEELKRSKFKDVQALQESHALIEADKAQHSATFEQLQQNLIEKDDLIEKLKRAEDENKDLNAQLCELNVTQQKENEKLCELKQEMRQTSKELEKYKQNQASLEMEIAQQLLRIDETNKLEQENRKLNGEIKIIENKFKQIETEFQILKNQLERSEANYNKLNSEFIHKSTDYDNKLIQINDLEKNNVILSDENIKLKNEVANFTSNILSLESEINNIKTSHKEIELEKNRLNDIIEKLDCKDQSRKSDSKDTQTEENNDAIDSTLKIENSAMFENKWILENKQTAMANTASLNLKTNMQEDIIEQYAALKNSYDALKDDNRRLHSDIEGLQSYLSKISKENSVLNDKLREVIATSEHSMDNDELSNNMNQLKTELEIGKEKINDLLRENSLLAEENLELKDQLNSQSFSKPLEMVKSNDRNDIENAKIKEQYDKLLQSTSDIKNRNNDLEQINRSVSGNITQLQEKNEKLKLSNEKLERRLDEALVSLRHLHSLQENTELEYLRNILYEYLTGSGTHSVTLAKVLAAIVKFDDMQTQLVLQKERERQGFLRQLGII